MIHALDPHYETMESELFGPVLSTYVYDDRDMEAVYHLVDSTSPYGLTGSVIARDRRAIDAASAALANASGNFYVNDKPTGRRRRPPTLRRRARLGDERQGRQSLEPHALGERAGGQGESRPAEGLALPLHGRGLIGAWRLGAKPELEACPGGSRRAFDGAELGSPAEIAREGANELQAQSPRRSLPVRDHRRVFRGDTLRLRPEATALSMAAPVPGRSVLDRVHQHFVDDEPQRDRRFHREETASDLDR